MWEIRIEDGTFFISEKGMSGIGELVSTRPTLKEAESVELRLMTAVGFVPHRAWLAKMKRDEKR